jgi:hypothetical protein
VHLLVEFVKAMSVVVEDDEALHLDASGKYRAGEKPKTVGAGGQFGVVVVGDQAAERDSGATVEQGQDSIEDRATDTLKVDINVVWAGRCQLSGEIRAAVIYANVKTQLIDYKTALCRAAGDSDYAATTDFGDLSHYRPYSTACGSNNYRFTLFGLADV